MLKVVGASWVQTRVSWWLLISISLLGVVALYFGPSYSAEPDGKYAATVYYGKESKFRLEYWGQNNDPADIKPGVARGFYQPDIFKTGWATLEIETQKSYPDNLQACAAGMLEGALSWQMIYHHWQNTIQKTCVQRQEFCARAREFLTRNAEEVQRKAEQADSSDPFWHQVNLFYIQLEGLAQGWRSGMKRSRRDYTNIPWIDFLWMNVMPDLRDLERRFNGTADFNPYRPPLSFVMLKYFPEDPSNFILTHGSSGTYNSMLRIQKRYNFAYHDIGDYVDSELVNGQIVTFSSYPGTIFSGDDFYQVRSVTGDQLTVVGTELKNNNQSTWGTEEEETTVLMGPRVMAANRLSRDADDWSALFTRRNSGTGNKQWLILDTSQNFTAWAVEQMPGLTHGQEVTQRIVEDRYWIACGIPYFQDILTQSEGYTDSSSLYHLKNLNPLYTTLKKAIPSISNVASVIDVMRSYEISIIGRSDLNGNSNLYGYLNVTASISKHHAHHHSHSEEATKSRKVSDVSVGKNPSSYPLTDPPVRTHQIVSRLEGIAQISLAKPKDFQSAHYYEHRDPVTDNLVSKDLADETGESRNYGRHKYAGVYRKMEKTVGDVTEVSGASRGSQSSDVESSSNRIVASSESSNYSEPKTSGSPESQFGSLENSGNQISQRSQISSTSSDTNSNRSGSSAEKASSDSSEQILPQERLPKDIPIIKTEANKTDTLFLKEKLETSHVNSFSVPDMRTSASKIDSPKIDFQFRSSKHLLHSKPTEKGTNLGTRFLNTSKHFRGIIDVKIAQGNADFIAISGPPYYRPKFSGHLNSTVVNATQTAATPDKNTQPFQWSTSNIRDQKHVGHPDLWNFDVFKASWVW